MPLRQSEPARRPFAALLRKLRTERNMSQGELAHRAGCKQPLISKYEKGVRNPSTRTLALLSSALELSDRDKGRLLDALKRQIGAEAPVDILGFKIFPPSRRFAIADERSKTLADGGKAFEAGDYVQTMKETARSQRESALALMRSAMRYRTMGLLREARDELHEAIAMVQGTADRSIRQAIFLNLADLLLQMQERDLAEAIVLKLEQIQDEGRLVKKRRPFFLLVRARCLGARARTPAQRREAREAFEQAKIASPDSKTGGLGGWIEIVHGEFEAGSPSRSERARGLARMRRAVDAAGPVAGPADAETVAWGSYWLYLHGGHHSDLEASLSLAERFGYEGLTALAQTEQARRSGLPLGKLAAAAGNLIGTIGSSTAGLLLALGLQLAPDRLVADTSPLAWRPGPLCQKSESLTGLPEPCEIRLRERLPDPRNSEERLPVPVQKGES